jgi:hypothetical protein
MTTVVQQVHAPVLDLLEINLPLPASVRKVAGHGIE